MTLQLVYEENTLRLFYKVLSSSLVTRNTMGVSKSVKHQLLLLTFADLRKYQRGLLGVIFSCGGNMHFHPGGRDAEI